ncbi:60 kDa SS-A/Ro ribonucleoprotein [Protopterus annectens]|uniref:60 kDa SS-A/Ro ribonucleoprotein n=1 Tax=Protopterus annectens TaxID=7888 RepID=UPI001CFA4B39|nr:60 kDa SS-A/Ro ribonucleoprotein [Protopterus annectens]
MYLCTSTLELHICGEKKKTSRTVSHCWCTNFRRQRRNITAGIGKIFSLEEEVMADSGEVAQPEGTDQMTPLNESQVPNSEGGYVWQVSDMTRMRRFLCFGSEGGTYYIGEKRLGYENATTLLRLLEEGKGCDVVEEIKIFSVEGRAAKQDPILFALAVCSQCKDAKTKQAAFKAMPLICRIPTHLFTFIQLKKDLKEGMSCGMWGRALRKAVADWYNLKDGMALALAVTKYKRRSGWAHKDLMRLCHLKPANEGKKLTCGDIHSNPGPNSSVHTDLNQPNSLYSRPTSSLFLLNINVTSILNKVQELHALLALYKPDLAILTETWLRPEHHDNEITPPGYNIIRKDRQRKKGGGVAILYQNNLTLEQFNYSSQDINDIELILAKLKLNTSKRIVIAGAYIPPGMESTAKNMPIMAMLRNLGKMTQEALLKPGSDEVQLVCERLKNKKLLKQARIHPFHVLIALETYRTGHGLKGKLRWNPDRDIVAALDYAFYNTFENVEPTGKRFLLAVDVSGSMSQTVLGSQLSASTVAAAMTMVVLRTEQHSTVVAFSNKMVPCPVTANMKLQEVLRTMQMIPMGGTDCALPMQWAQKTKTPADVFIVFTDNETYAGKIHPAVALRKYRTRMNIPAKLIVCGMTSNGFTIADPKDSGMLDICGFDTGALEVIRSFTLGLI